MSHVFGGFQFLGVILVTAIPFGIYDLVEAIDNVESAAVAGDSFPTTRVLTADGVVSLIGCLMGNPFINAVYIGHPGWKAMGGRIGYSAATGVTVLILSWFGIISVMSSLIPVVAISPILLYIGMLIGAQAFQETPKTHAPAIVLALVPHIAAWGKLQIDNTLAAAGTNAAAVGIDKLAGKGILYQGLSVLGGGSILGGRHAGLDRGLHHRSQVRQGIGLRAGGRGPDVPRLHARRGDRLRPDAGRRGGLPGRRHGAVRLLAHARARASGRARRDRTWCRRSPNSRRRSSGSRYNRRMQQTDRGSTVADDFDLDSGLAGQGLSIRRDHARGGRGEARRARATAPRRRSRIHRVPRADLIAAARAVEARAQQAGAERERALPLYGIPFAVKDNIDVAGLPTTAACPAYGYVARASATVVQRLTDAGALVIGKTNMDQLATGLVGVRSPYGIPRNPFDARYITRRVELGLGGRGRRGAGELRARHRHGRLGPRAGGLQQPGRPQAERRPLQHPRRGAGLPLARLRVDLRAHRRGRLPRGLDHHRGRPGRSAVARRRRAVRLVDRRRAARVPLRDPA